jgi:hypothetical protein
MSEFNEPQIINGITVDPYCEACPLVVSCIDRVAGLIPVREAQVHANSVYDERLEELDEMSKTSHAEQLRHIRELISQYDTAEDMELMSKFREEFIQSHAANEDEKQRVRMERLGEHMTSLALIDYEMELYRALAHNLQADCRKHREMKSTRRGRFLLGLKGMFTYSTGLVSGCDAPHARDIRRTADHYLIELSNVRIERMMQGWF